MRTTQYNRKCLTETPKVLHTWYGAAVEVISNGLLKVMINGALLEALIQILAEIFCEKSCRTKIIFTVEQVAL